MSTNTSISISLEALAHFDFSDVADVTAPRMAPIHPGVILLEDWLKPMGLSQYALSKAIGVPPRRINEIVHGQRGITVDTALRLAAFFGTDAQSWVNLQTHFDTETAREKMAEVLGRIGRYEGLAAHA
jgi:addiction module HigA family antidote